MKVPLTGDNSSVRVPLSPIGRALRLLENVVAEPAGPPGERCMVILTAFLPPLGGGNVLRAFSVNSVSPVACTHTLVLGQESSLG